MGEFLRTEKRYCDCVGTTFEGWVIKTADGSIFWVCPCCGKMQFIDKVEGVL